MAHHKSIGKKADKQTYHYPVKVSVILPTYNRARYIGDSIRSVISQTYTNIEIIVVDDGSNDDSGKIISSFQDSRIKYFYQENQGRSVARNYALRIARGEYITFQDSDDLYLSNKIELQVNYLDTHPETAMVYTSAYCIDGEGITLNYKYEATVSGFIYKKIAFFLPVTITLPTVMARREVFDKVGGFDEKMHRFEDTDMWRRISKCYKIDAMHEYTCKLRTHEDNHLSNQLPEKITAALDYYAKKILMEDKKISYSLRTNGLANLYEYYGNALLTLPQFEPNGRDLLEIARNYRKEGEKMSMRNPLKSIRIFYQMIAEKL
jgi:glycosyltransferase involved in cell wall biosynthesis